MNHPAHIVRFDQLDIFKLDRTWEKVQAGIVLRQRTLEQREVKSGNVLRDVSKRIIGDHIQIDIRIAKTQVKID